jgi:hypothetical protein
VHALKLLFLFLQMVVVVGMVVNQSEKKQMMISMMISMMMPMTNATVMYVLMQMTHSMMMN